MKKSGHLATLENHYTAGYAWETREGDSGRSLYSRHNWRSHKGTGILTVFVSDAAWKVWKKNISKCGAIDHIPKRVQGLGPKVIG